jgi:hypothetical protein
VAPVDLVAKNFLDGGLQLQDIVQPEGGADGLLDCLTGFFRNTFGSGNLADAGRSASGRGAAVDIDPLLINGAIDPHPAGIERNGYFTNFLPATEIDSHLSSRFQFSSSNQAETAPLPDFLCDSELLGFS